MKEPKVFGFLDPGMKLESVCTLQEVAGVGTVKAAVRSPPGGKVERGSEVGHIPTPTVQVQVALFLTPIVTGRDFEQTRI